MNVFLDIETVPSDEQWVLDYIKNNLKPPASMKKQDTIDKWWAEKSEDAAIEAHEKCSFDGAMNKVVCIGVAIEDQEPVSFYLHKDANDLFDGLIPEKKILEDFAEYIAVHTNGHSVYIGHNVLGFDLNVLKKRFIICGAKPPPCLQRAFSAKPWGIEVYDTMIKWDSKNSDSLDKIAKALGIEGKKGFNGSMVWQMFKDGSYEQISEYCEDDVKLVREVYNKMKFVI